MEYIFSPALPIILQSRIERVSYLMQINCHSQMDIPLMAILVEA